jgi:hypothetical protein
MTVERYSWARTDVLGTDEFSAVRGVADRLLDRLNAPDSLERIAAANQPGQSSAMVQAAFRDAATELGFRSEAVGLFGGYENRALRPDYFLPLGDTGILMEVERGKTTTNNMDLLDFWKCHLCEHAHYLFLLVPQELRHNPTMTPKKEYAAVVKRLGSFFVPRNRTNVRAVFIFGY